MTLADSDSGAQPPGRFAREAGPCQLVQLSVAGLVVTVGEPSVAVTPIRDGIEKYVSSHAAGAVAVMLASLVNVTVNGLSAWPLAATVTGVVRTCELPLAAVE